MVIGSSGPNDQISSYPHIIPSRLSLDLQKFDFKIQGSVRRNHATGACGAITQIGRNDEFALAAGLHSHDTLRPTLDHALSHAEFKRLTAIQRAVELAPAFAVDVEPAGVVHLDALPGLDSLALSFLVVDDF